MPQIDRRQALSGAFAGLTAVGAATAASAAQTQGRWSQPLPVPAMKKSPSRIAADKARTVAVLKAHRLDAMIVLRPHNVTYFTNATPVVAAFKSEFPGFAVVAAREDAPFTYVGTSGSTWAFGYEGAEKPQAIVPLGRGENWQDYDNASPEQMRKEPKATGRSSAFAMTHDHPLTERERWWVYAQEELNSHAAPGYAWGLVRALKELGVTRGRVGTDDMRVAYLLQQIGFDAVTVVPADSIMRQIRIIKTPYEVELMRVAQQGTQDAAMAASKALKVGMTYEDFRRQFFTEAMARGCEPGFLLFGVTQGLLPDEEVRAGRCYMLDSSTRYRNYMGDFARTIAIGEPSKLTMDRFKAQQIGREAGLNAVKVGVKRSVVENACRAAMLKAGMPEGVISAITLHSVGLEHGDEPISENPYAPGLDYTLAPNMCLTLDLPFMEVGWGAGHGEDMIRITETGFEFLNSTDDPIVIV